MKLNIDDSDTNEWFELTLFLLHNSIILDKAKHWSVLLFKEALAIHRQKPELNQSVLRTTALLLIDIKLQTIHCIYWHYYVTLSIPDDD
jgi:hypothetical protein